MAWMASDEAETAALPGPVVLELFDGCSSKLDIKRVQVLTERFRVYWPTRADNERARLAFAEAKLLHGIGILDMLIGQIAIGCNATLLTFNTKHFRSIEGLRFEKPYTK